VPWPELGEANVPAEAGESPSAEVDAQAYFPLNIMIIRVDPVHPFYSYICEKTARIVIQE
jgi:hypothetical protein